MTIKTIRTHTDRTVSSLRVVGFHGRLGLDQTPARRAPVYADARGRPVTILEASPYGAAGKHSLTIEVSAEQISADTWATTGTLVRPPWPAKLGDYVAIIGEREERLAPSLVAGANADTPARVTAFWRWITTATDRSEELRCARVDGMVVWYTNPTEIRALCSQIAARVRANLLHCAQAAEPRALISMSFWLSRAAVDEADTFLAVAGLRHAGSPHWKTVLDAGAHTGSEKTRLAAIDAAMERLRPAPKVHMSGSSSRSMMARRAIRQSIALLSDPP